MTWKFLPERVKIEEHLVTEVQERVIVHTRIVERPDGTKETIIEEKRDTDTKSEWDKLTTPASVYSVRLSQSISGEYSQKTVYTLGIDKKLLGSFSVGLYGRTDKELGFSLGYSF